MYPVAPTQPVNVNTLFQGLDLKVPCRVRNDGDPVISWDRLNNRFLLVQFTATSSYCLYVAVSKTEEPTQGWWVYQQRLSNNVLWDYPWLAAFRDNYVFTFNRLGDNYKGGVSEPSGPGSSRQDVQCLRQDDAARRVRQCATSAPLDVRYAQPHPHRDQRLTGERPQFGGL